MQQPRQSGFTLIELMIVVVIIGILAAVALPMYQNYAKRAKLSEVVLAASACRTAISEVYQSNSSMPSGWGCNVSAQASRYVKTITADANGVITVTAAGFGDTEIDDKQIRMVPFHDNTTPKSPTTAGHLGAPVFKWVCGPAPTAGIPLRLLPNSCGGS